MVEGDEEHSGECDSECADGPEFEFDAWSEAGEVVGRGLAGCVFVCAEDSGCADEDAGGYVADCMAEFHRFSPSTSSVN